MTSEYKVEAENARLSKLQLKRFEDNEIEEDVDSAEEREADEVGRRAHIRNKIRSLKAECEDNLFSVC